MMRLNAKVFVAAMAAAVTLCSGCSDSSGPTTTAKNNELSALIVSPIVHNVTSSRANSSTSSRISARYTVSAAASGMNAYVSLPPGSVPGGIRAVILEVTAGDSLTVQMLNGGFDPVAIAANVGDSVSVTVTRAGSAAPVSGFERVRAHGAPAIVRSSPPRGQKDVALNAIIVVVFSEPLDSTTVDTSSIQLVRGTTRVTGTVRFADAQHLRVEFHPDAPLAPLTDYQLVVTQAVRDANGVALESALNVPFTTGTIGAATGLVFASMSVGTDHSCGVTTSGTAYCWGANDASQIGDGTTYSSTTPVAVAGGLTFAKVSAGVFHTCGVTTVGALYCWGPGYQSPGDGSTPELVFRGISFADVSVGDSHACGITAAGTAYCWGPAGRGELGDSTVYGGPPPARVAGGLTFAAVSAGGGVSCGLTMASVAYCWGDNVLGELGIGSSTGPEQCQAPPFSACSTVPVAVTGGLTFRQVVAKVEAACGVTTSGSVLCWGSNANDDLGFGTLTGPSQCAWDPNNDFPCTDEPLLIPGSPKLVSLSAADSYTCGLTSAGAAYCWGYPQSIGDLTSNTSPVAVPGGLAFATLSAGPYVTCGVTTASVAYCWGDNTYGELGNGTTVSSRVPVKVAGQP